MGCSEMEITESKSVLLTSSPAWSQTKIKPASGNIDSHYKALVSLTMQFLSIRFELHESADSNLNP